MRPIRSQLRILAAFAIWADGPAFAQTGSQAVPENIAPDAKPSTLSGKLDNSNGVIAPKEVDPGIEKPTPKTADPSVLPPPATKGGAQAK